jgi:hypothetical protein
MIAIGSSELWKDNLKFQKNKELVKNKNIRQKLSKIDFLFLYIH